MSIIIIPKIMKTVHKKIYRFSVIRDDREITEKIDQKYLTVNSIIASMLTLIYLLD